MTELSGIVAIVRAKEPVDLVATCRALAEGGIQTMEITLNTPGALDGITAAREALGDSVRIGAGTILCPEDAELAIGHGAQFLVTPTLQPASVAVSMSHGVPICCGAMTPTEILAAHQAGSDYVKLFPASSLGLDYIKAVLAPLPFIRFVPTGGVNLQNLRDFLAVCPAVGVGGNLVDVKLLATQDWDTIRSRAAEYVAVAEGR